MSDPPPLTRFSLAQIRKYAYESIKKKRIHEPDLVKERLLCEKAKPPRTHKMLFFTPARMPMLGKTKTAAQRAP